jgi:uncharacterized protein (TIGR02452 family)
VSALNLMALPRKNYNMKRITIAKETLQIIEAGQYQSSNGSMIDISSSLKKCVSQTHYFDPERLIQIKKDILKSEKKYQTTEFEVKNETTLTGMERLSSLEGIKKIGVLNFASAKNPGGGFLNGAQAQEESLARSSGLYSSLLEAREYYEQHRSQKSCLYSDRMIYSPGCPVFRRDNGQLLDKPYLVDFITSPAPNAGVVMRKEPQNVNQIQTVLFERGSKVLGLFAHYGCDSLVLGAWGCGVFRNDPTMVAEMFYQLLGPKGVFFGRFKSVLFSVLDHSKTTKIYLAFKKRFQS